MKKPLIFISKTDCTEEAIVKAGDLLSFNQKSNGNTVLITAAWVELAKALPGVTIKFEDLPVDLAE